MRPHYDEGNKRRLFAQMRRKENLSIYYSHHLFFLKKHYKSLMNVNNEKRKNFLMCLLVLPKKKKRNEKKGANERPKNWKRAKRSKIWSKIYFFLVEEKKRRFFSFLFGFFFFFFLQKNHPVRKNTTHIKTDKNTKHHRRESEEEISRLVDTSSLCESDLLLSGCSLQWKGRRAPSLKALLSQRLLSRFCVFGGVVRFFSISFQESMPRYTRTKIRTSSRWTTRSYTEAGEKACSNRPKMMILMTFQIGAWNDRRD